MSEARIKWAYKVDDGDGHGIVVFAEDEPEAIRLADYDGVYADEVEQVKRYDRYAPGPVPMKVLLADGWFFECWNCCHQVTQDGCDDCIKPNSDGCYVPVCTKDKVFCSRHCYREYVEDQRLTVKEKAQAIRAIRRLMRENFPGAKVVKVSTTYEKVGDRRFSGMAEFRFPGSKGTANYREVRPEECYVQNQDLDAWGIWRGKPAKILHGIENPVDSHAQEVKS